MSTLHQFQECPAYTVARMGRFILGMFGNSVARGFLVADNLGFSRICGAIVLILALIGLVAAWRRGLFRMLSRKLFANVNSLFANESDGYKTTSAPSAFRSSCGRSARIGARADSRAK